MKRIIFIFIIIFTLFSTQAQAFDFYVLGVNLKWLKNAEPKDYGMILLGATTSFVIHETGHYLDAKRRRVDIQFNGISYDLIGNVSQKDKRNIARSGFILQSFIGTLLTSFDLTKDSYFTKGYTGFEAATLPLYNSMFDGEHNDFKAIRDNGGDEDAFFYSISTISLHNILRQKW